MINSASAVDFNFNKNNNNNNDIVLPPEMVPSDKVNLLNTSHIVPHASNAKLSSQYIELFSRQPYAPIRDGNSNTNTNSILRISETKEIDRSQVPNNEINGNGVGVGEDRVKVQHLQTHTKLQNNRWNCQTFHTLTSGNPDKSHVKLNFNNNNNNNNNNNSSYNKNNNQNLICNQDHESAFRKRYTTMGDDIERQEGQCRLAKPGTESNHNNNNNNNNIEKDNTTLSVAAAAAATTLCDKNNCKLESDRQSTPIIRTEDQENAFRRIEDVHNYAKLNCYSYSNESSMSSMHEDEDEDEEELDEDADADADGDNDLESFFNKTQRSLGANTKTSGTRLPEKGSSTPQESRKRKMEAEEEVEIEETDTNVDIETVPKARRIGSETAAPASAPDHHARRPMNAFLIFCKRHRAIVKERYKSLENRAITKILGEWWASLEAKDKECFTLLSQQNKDAFLAANPDFKWYKLPAPPLRTLNTRPSNTERNVTFEHEPDDHRGEDHCFSKAKAQPTKSNNDSNYFKLADEAQMGDLSTLISSRDHNAVHSNALQEALGETTQFLSTHIPHCSPDHDIDRRNDTSVKRKLYAEPSLSSNSSEDDLTPKKNSRSCKGKRYQELINSGQISAVAKKVKVPKSRNPSGMLTLEDRHVNRQEQDYNEISSNFDSNNTSNSSPSNSVRLEMKVNGGKRTISSHEATSFSESGSFDLEEKIKELPALSLDAYLQRKRSSKKKKKFSSKKRNSNSISSKSSTPPAAVPHSSQSTTTPLKVTRDSPPQQPPAVGSQKRKARKESITRRDVSAIENEIASLIPLPTNCYYFNELPEATILVHPYTSPPKAFSNTSNQFPNSILTSTSTSTSTSTARSAPTSTCSAASTTISTCNSKVFSNFNENISSTSDLLILAEVAANRTELAN